MPIESDHIEWETISPTEKHRHQVRNLKTWPRFFQWIMWLRGDFDWHEVRPDGMVIIKTIEYVRREDLSFSRSKGL